MNFSVGYSVCKTNALIDEIIRDKLQISEVYFSFGKMSSGRNDQTRFQDLCPWEAQAKQIDDIKILHKEGIKFNLLFNANCYGDKAQAHSFFAEIGETVEYMCENFSLSSVTTTSPLIAKFIKQNFPRIETRASVNMEIGSILGMEYVADVFDSFYVKRELNRDFTALKTLRKWCDENGKEMYLLANSGCLNDCSAHTFHDNLVAHEEGLSRMDNGYEFTGVCKKYLSQEKNRQVLLSGTNYIRPEDIELYEEIVPAMKLATRVHENPLRILRAYIERKKFVGNIVSLLEPNHSDTIYPYVLENDRIKRKIENEKLIYTNVDNAFVKSEENYAYQQND